MTAPTGGSAGVMPAIVYALGEGGRKLPQDKIRDGFLAAAAVGYLCKHNATLSGAEGGCQAEIGVASAMGAAFLAQAHDFSNQVVANAAESSLQHHLGMTCDPVAGFVQVPCIERCAFGAVKSWTGFMIASNEIPANRRVDFDTTVTAMALTAKEMNAQVQGDVRGRPRRLRGALLDGTAVVTRARQQRAVVGAWLITAVYYFYQYTLRSAPAVMMPQLSEAFGMTATAVASLVGLFYYGYSPFSLVAGAAMDRLGPRKVVPIGAAAVGVGALMFATGNSNARERRALAAGRGRRVRARRRRLHRDHQLPRVARGHADRRHADVRHGRRLGRPVRRRPDHRVGHAVEWRSGSVMGVAGLVIAALLLFLLAVATPARREPTPGDKAVGRARARRSCSAIRSRSSAA